MKQNWLQLLCIALCILLLVVTLNQNHKLQRRCDDLQNEIFVLRDTLTGELRNTTADIRQELEAAAKLVSDYSLKPAGVSAQDRALVADVSVTLKQWHPDTQVTLAAELGENRTSLTADTEGDGVYTARIAIPLEGSGSITLAANISGDGMTRREELGAWSDFSMLLPLRMSGGGWDGPNYVNGVLSSNFNMDIQCAEGRPEVISEPQFQIYRNGELAQTIPAVEEWSSSDWVAYTTDTQGNRWQLECDQGDIIDIRFLCRDEYGLGYDFLFATWVAGASEMSADGTATESAGATYQSGSSPLTLFWPE